MSENPKRISVVIPTCHRNFDLGLCLDRLLPGVQSLGSDFYEVIVSDDGLTETAEGLILNRYPWVRWTQGPRRGPAANRNHGARFAQAEWIAFTDDDCIPDRNWLVEVLAATDGNDLVEGATLPSDQRLRLDQECPLNGSGGLFWSCNLAVKKSAFRALSGFDESFPVAAMEDVEFRLRFRKANYISIFQPRAIVRHPWRISKGADFSVRSARAVKRFFVLHPEARAQTSVARHIVDTIRKVWHLVFKLGPKYRFRGLGRALCLTIHSSFCVAREVFFGSGR